MKLPDYSRRIAFAVLLVAIVAAAILTRGAWLPHVFPAPGGGSRGQAQG